MNAEVVSSLIKIDKGVGENLFGELLQICGESI